MRLKGTVLLAAVLMAGMPAGQGGAVAQTPPEGFVWYVLNQMNAFSLDLEDPTDRPPLITGVPDGVLTAVEVNGDGRPDWLIRWPESAQFCGTGGCQASLYISDGDGFVRAFDRQALTLDLRRVDGEVRLETTLHHLNCDDGRFDCRFAWAWSPAAGRLEERPASDGVSRITIVQPVDRGEAADGTPVLPDWTPPTLEERWTASRAVCPGPTDADGPYRRQATLYDIPDVNGDGLRDYVYTPDAGCETPPETGFQVWVTEGAGPGPYGRGGAVALAWTAPQDHWPEVDVATRPAVVIQREACGEGESCPSVSLQWDAASGRLTE